MTCVVTNAPDFSAQPLDLSLLPEQPLYGQPDPLLEDIRLGWPLSPQPYALSADQHAALNRLGPLLLRFVQAIDELYRLSSQAVQAGETERQGAPDWVSGVYDQGKPDLLLQFARMKRIKSQMPLVLRPDLLVRDDGGWTLCEIDAVPGGLGFTSAMNRFYRQNNLPVLEPATGMPGLFLEMLKACVPKVENPVIAIVLSDESADYRAEMQWLVDTIRHGSDLAGAYPDIALLHPRDLDLVRDRLIFTDAETGEEKGIDVLYRFFELFDLPNIPKIELIQYAIKKALVTATAPFKPHLEEKLSLALLHHPALAAYWQKALGKDDFNGLLELVPPGWIVDPTPVPPQAVIAGLAPAGQPLRDFSALKALSQKGRQLVLKPSGFSPLGWGSRGVTIGHDHPGEVWAERVDEALQSFGQTPYILQEYRAGSVLPAQKLDLKTGQSTSFESRIRLCPYYFVVNGEAQLAGALATACPANKKLIHGMKDAVMMPVSKP